MMAHITILIAKSILIFKGTFSHLGCMQLPIKKILWNVIDRIMPKITLCKREAINIPKVIQSSLS